MTLLETGNLSEDITKYKLGEAQYSNDPKHQDTVTAGKIKFLIKKKRREKKGDGKTEKGEWKVVWKKNKVRTGKSDR